MSTKITPAGTRYEFNPNGTLLYECQYCQTWFEPTTRFKQKYCCESCRVMASRERTASKSSKLSVKNKTVSNGQLLKYMKTMNRKIDWLFFVTAIAPVATPALIDWFRRVINDSGVESNISDPSIKPIVSELKGLLSQLNQEQQENLKQFLVENKLEYLIKEVGL